MCFLWVLLDDQRLTAEARAMIEGASEVYVSAASVWEIAIKSALGKIEADPFAIVSAIEPTGFIELPISAVHAAQVATLPAAEDHKDPFDRLLVAQSMIVPLILVTADKKLARYGGMVRSI